MKETHVVYGITLVIVMLMGIVLRCAEAHERVAYYATPTWQPPVIEQCDKPAWDRIREGCDG